MNISFAATDEEVRKIDMLKTAMRHSTRSDVLRHAIMDAYDVFFAKNLPTGNTQPSPSPSPAPAARHVPTVEELVADYRADGCMMPTYWRHLTEEERDRVASECNLSESDLEFLEGTLEENR